MHKDNPSEQTVWPIELGENLWAEAPPLDRAVPLSELLLRGLDKDTLKRDESSRSSGDSPEALGDAWPAPPAPPVRRWPEPRRSCS